MLAVGLGLCIETIIGGDIANGMAESGRKSGDKGGDKSPGGTTRLSEALMAVGNVGRARGEADDLVRGRW
jgi:hypothetical protein